MTFELNNLEVVGDLARSKLDDGTGAKTWLEWVQERKEIETVSLHRFWKEFFCEKGERNGAITGRRGGAKRAVCF